MESRRKMSDVDDKISALAEKISRSGGLSGFLRKSSQAPPRTQSAQQGIQSALERIIETGCVVKDLDVGLLDFPARIDDQDVYLCWKLGEDRIRFYHRQDEGFSGRKPIDPRDRGHNNPIQ